MDWTLKSAMLACKRFKGRHTGENIEEVYNEIVSAFDVTSKVSAVITDNAANMVKAFALPGYPSQETSEDNELCDEDCDYNYSDEDGSELC